MKPFCVGSVRDKSASLTRYFITIQQVALKSEGVRDDFYFLCINSVLVHLPPKIIKGLLTNSNPFYLKLVIYEILRELKLHSFINCFVLIKH